MRKIEVDGDDIYLNGQKVAKITVPAGSLHDDFVASIKRAQVQTVDKYRKRK